MPANFSRYFIEAAGNTIFADHWNGEFDNILTNFTPAGMDDDSANLVAMQATTNPGTVGGESLATDLSGEIRRIRYVLKTITGGSQWYAATGSLLPVGTILPFYDFSALVTFDTNIFKYCDGSVVSDVTSPLNGQTLPDLSNRYLVGFGTEGGGDIDTAAWATPAVGNASHQIDLAHTHSGASHVHTGPSHTHSSGSITANYGAGTFGIDIVWESVSSASWTSTEGFSPNANSDSTVTSRTIGLATEGSTDAGGTGDTGASGTGATSSSLSSTQSIQPRSLRVRFIIRYK